MRARFALTSLSAAALLFGATAAIAQPAAPAPAPAPAPAKDAPAKTAPAKDAKDTGKAGATSGPRRDPDGIRGISPYMEAIKKGEDAYVARDFQGAVSAFQEAIKLDVQKMIGYYRIGEAQLALNNIPEAEAQWQNALTKTGPDDLKAKVYFVLADLRERQMKWQEAKDAWTAYANFLTSNPKALGYPATGVERQKMIDRRVKDEKDYGEVKERIKKREAERIKEAEENAKKDTKNK
jgi:tetratricopeptide (TPR) repeat protein